MDPESSMDWQRMRSQGAIRVALQASVARADIFYQLPCFVLVRRSVTKLISAFGLEMICEHYESTSKDSFAWNQQ